MPIVYIISESNNRVKIGFTSKSVEQRLKALQTGNSNRLEVIAVIPSADRRVESALHRKYRHYRKAGEWFELPPNVMRELRETLSRI